MTAPAPVSGGYPAREGVGAEQHMKPTGPASPRFGREEKECLNVPKEFLNVSTLNVWLAKVATARTEASV